MKVLTKAVPLTTTQEERDEFDQQFNKAIDKGYRPDELDRHGDTVPKKTAVPNRDAPSGDANPNETKLQAMVRQRKERLNA